MSLYATMNKFTSVGRTDRRTVHGERDSPLARTPESPSHSSAPDVAAYYFPGFHVDPATTRWHGAQWTEWDLLKSARPRFEGHRQPRTPSWGYFDESQPEWAAMQADYAAAHGIDALIFDWYWYEGRPFLNAPLDDGFLSPEVDLPIRFALMWANHDWLAIHPGTTAHEPPVLFEGVVDRARFDGMVEHVIRNYFVHPAYYLIDGAPYFSIYEPETLIRGLGGMKETAQALAYFRSRVVAAGFPDLHLNVVLSDRAVLPGERMTSDVTSVFDAFGAASATSYVWIHHYDSSRHGFPAGSYARAAAANEDVWQEARTRLDVPYFPNVTVGWDSSPRALQTDRFENRGYPWIATLDGTPDEFAAAMRSALRFAADGAGPKLVTVNAWNEWTEGSYLLPDTHHGDAFARAILDAKHDVAESAAAELSDAG